MYLTLKKNEFLALKRVLGALEKQYASASLVVESGALYVYACDGALLWIKRLSAPAETLLDGQLLDAVCLRGARKEGKESLVIATLTTGLKPACDWSKAMDMLDKPFAGLKPAAVTGVNPNYLTAVMGDGAGWTMYTYPVGGHDAILMLNAALDAIALVAPICFGAECVRDQWHHFDTSFFPAGRHIGR